MESCWSGWGGGEGFKSQAGMMPYERRRAGFNLNQLRLEALFFAGRV